jgi:tetratricopeptide (TPR) repeat protein
VEARERWEALQSNLRQARTAYAAGDRLGAIQAIDAALELDPQYLAAQSLRSQVLARTDWPGAPATSAEPVIQPQISAEGYARFEERAKDRRVQRRLAAARTAIAGSRFEDAAAAVDELRELNPNLVDLPALSRAIARGPAPPSAPAPSTSHRSKIAAAIAGIIVLAAWSLPRGPSRLPLPRILPSVSTVVELPAPAPAVAETPEASVPEPVPVATSAESTIRPRVLDTETVTRSPVAPVVPVSVVEQPRRQDVVQFAPLNPGNTVAPAPVPAPIPAVPAPETVTAPADVIAPGSVPAAVTVNDDQLVREALQRYRSAYEGLDAASAHDIWPAVDQAALARAFDGLASQALTFQDCAVAIEGAAATATCRGTTQYVPKVGSRVPRVEPRRWNFSLRKRAAGWQIENARAER